MYCGHDTTSIIINNTLCNNHALWAGQGMSFEEASPYLTSNIIWDCPAGEIYSFSGSEPIYSYNNIEGYIAPGDSNISVDPLFRCPDSADFHLMAIYCGDPYVSPCIDAGDPEIFDFILDCDFGLGGERSDMGAYGGDNLGYPTEVIEEEIIVPEKITLLQNYPNPFNAATTIRYFVSLKCDVSLSIFNLLGQRVEKLFGGVQNAGEHSITWDASEYPSGIYFAQLEAEGRIENIKMVLLK